MNTMRWTIRSLAAATLGLVATLGGHANAAVCNIGFDDQAGLQAITDDAATTFVSEPDYYAQACPGSTVAHVHEADNSFQWQHYHLMYEDECVTLCFPPNGLGFGRDLSCVDPMQTGCASIDLSLEPRVLASMSADHRIDVLLSNTGSIGSSETVCGGTAGQCVSAEGKLFRPTSIDTLIAVPIDGSPPNLVGVKVVANVWSLQSTATGSVPVSAVVEVDFLGTGTHNLSGIGVVDWIQFTGITTMNNAGSFGVDNLVIDSVECGDGALDPNEVCDDGNTADGDGCPADCSSPVKAFADADPSTSQKDKTVECQADGVSVPLSGLDSTGSGLSYAWTSGAPLTGANTATPTALVTETTPVNLTVTDGTYTSSDYAFVYVLDTLAPTVGPDAEDEVAELACQVDTQSITLDAPPFLDGCDSSDELFITGTVTTSSDPSVPTPVVFDAGDAISLPMGTYVIVWRATDTSGNWTEFEQLLDIRPAIYATNSIYVRENFSEVRQSVGVPAAIVNSGTNITDIRNDALTGDILSVAPVNLGYRANVGDVRSQTAINWDHNAAIGDRPVIGSETIGPVVLPPPFNLASITFPTTAGTVNVNDGSGAPLNPGNYGTYYVNSGGTLRLNAGTYFFEGLTINSAGKIVTTADTVLYIKNSQRFQGPIVNSSNQQIPVVLGFAGTTLNLEANFLGTIVAPNATVNLGNGSAQLFRGVIHAKVINQQNGADFECVALECNSSICDNSGGSGSTCGNGTQDPDETGVDCGGPCSPCAPTCTAAVYEAETMFHSTGNAATGGWNIYTNGYISTNHTFTAGPKTIVVTARGQAANGVWPHMLVRVNGTIVGNVNVTSTSWTTYSFNYNATAGSANIQVVFDNDLYAPPQDRNLFVDKVNVNCP